MQKIFGPRGENKVRIVRSFCRRGHAFDGQIEFVDRIVLVAGSVFDRAARQSDRRGASNGFGARVRRAAESILQIGGNRQERSVNDGFRVLQHSVERDRGIGINASSGEGVTGAGGGQSFEAQRRKNFCRSGAPRIGNQENSGRSCRALKALRIFLRASAWCTSIRTIELCHKLLLPFDAASHDFRCAKIANERKALEKPRSRDKLHGAFYRAAASIETRP